MEVKETIRKFLSRYVGDKPFDDADNIFEKGYVNSLFFMQLVLFIEKQFQITIENEDLAMGNFQDVNSIAAFVNSRLLNAHGLK
ncbi:Acyl carrier protein [Paenibacillus tianmuensis]|uniref:Acyl carrier protein n=1 Tax=Paenibacillus tianmuensis TaxID=624147 RepID=A0A1G4QZI1_9BACL|nr:acyl carrier protein [Paenibacillus tianmuensis]SCW49996.1 Acyl carrier protein [Paenibacillus tianmuensis]